MTQQKTNVVTPDRLLSDRVTFLRHRIAILKKCISTDVVIIIKNHEAEIQDLIEVMADICVDEYKKQYGEK
jgi:hypothetical protein